MFESMRKQWRSFRETPAGQRFQNAHEQRGQGRSKSGPAVRACYLAGGVVLTAAGFLLMPLPGPGSLVALGGLAMLARESIVVARSLDWADLKLENGWEKFVARWRKWGWVQRSCLAIVALLLIMSAGYGLWLLWKG